MMKMGPSRITLVWGSRYRVTGRYFSWCFEPAGQSGRDVAANPELLPPVLGEHAEQNDNPSMSPGTGCVLCSLGEAAMDTIYRSVAGLDVHKKTIAACLRRINEQGQVTEQVRTFGTMTRDLLALSDWLQAADVTHVAMESTGVLWKPVFNVLEGPFKLLLVNPRDIKQVPGRKTDVSDCQWIAQLLGCGLLQESYVPERDQRQLRDLTRQRAQLVGETTRVANRIHKTLEDANIKLGAVASDILGVSGRDMLRALIAGERDPDGWRNGPGGV